jgi:hypothetical protein
MRSHRWFRFLQRPTPAEPVSTGADQNVLDDHITKSIFEPYPDIKFPVDAVYTWVDKTGELLEEARARSSPYVDRSLFESHDELLFSLRSIATYAPWINQVYIVTNGQRPSWLSNSANVTIIPHSEILQPRHLPTFNSHVIESALHKIQGLSEHYLYFNDDMLLLRATRKSDFFTGNGLAYAFIGPVQLSNDQPHPKETATNWGAKNAMKLVKSRFGSAPNHRLAHIVSPQLKSVATGCEEQFSAEYERFRHNRGRSMDDLLVSGYLNPVVGYLQSKFLFARTPYWYVKIRDHSAPNSYSVILSQKNSSNSRAFACFNDQPRVGGQLTDAERLLKEFLAEYFPSRSVFEA